MLDSQLQRSCQPTDVDQIILSVQDCISDIKDWLTDNKLQLNEDKTEALLLNSSKLQDPSASLSICQTTVTFSDSVRNLGFSLDKDQSVKEQFHLQELRRISTIRHYLSDDATKTLVVSLVVVLSQIDYCNPL